MTKFYGNIRNLAHKVFFLGGDYFFRLTAYFYLFATSVQPTNTTSTTTTTTTITVPTTITQSTSSKTSPTSNATPITAASSALSGDFYRDILNAGRSSREKGVCPSVCPSAKRVNCDKTVEKSVQIFIPYERSFSLVFWEEECLVGATPSTWNFVSTGLRWSEIADLNRYSLVAPKP